MIVSHFRVPNDIYNIIKSYSNIEWKTHEEYLSSDEIEIYPTATGIKVKLKEELMGMWISNIKISELFGVMTLFIQTELFSIELRTENFKEEKE